MVGGGGTGQTGAATPSSDAAPQASSTSTANLQEPQRQSLRREREEQRRLLQETRQAHLKAHRWRIPGSGCATAASSCANMGSALAFHDHRRWDTAFPSRLSSWKCATSSPKTRVQRSVALRASSWGGRGARTKLFNVGPNQALAVGARLYNHSLFAQAPPVSARQRPLLLGGSGG